MIGRDHKHFYTLIYERITTITHITVCTYYTDKIEENDMDSTGLEPRPKTDI